MAARSRTDGVTVTDCRGSWTGVAFGIGIAAFAAYQQFKLPVVLPLLLEQYGYPRTLAGGFMSVYALAGLVLSVWVGRTVERYGAVGPVMLAMGLILLGSGLSLVAPHNGLIMLAGRGLEGAAFAAVAVAGPVLANANAPARQLPLVIGLTATWIPVGQLSATGLAPLALGTAGWSLLWWLGMGAAVIVMGATCLLRRNPAVVLNPAQLRSIGEPQGLTPRDRITLTLAAAIFMIWSGQYFAYMTWLPQFLVEVHGLDVSAALVGYVVPVAFVLVFNLIGGAVLRAGVALGPLLVTAMATQVAVWWLLPVTGGDWTGVLSLVVYGCGAGIVPTCLFAIPSALVGVGGNVASAFGVIMTGRNFGVLVGPVLLAYVVGIGDGWLRGAFVFAVLTTAALAIALPVAQRLKR